jgi:hypothetical protein
MEGRRTTISSSGEFIGKCCYLNLSPASIRAIGKVYTYINKYSDTSILSHPSIHPSINQSPN